MHELTRLAYLDALGVVSWIPRDPLANAAQIPAESMPEAKPEAREPGFLSPDKPADELTGRIQPGEPKGPVGTAEPPRALPETAALVASAVKEQPVSAPLAPFYLQLWLAGPCALLLEISEPGLEQATAPYRLLVDILRAAGLPERPALFADFQWPLTRNPQFDRSAAAASQALTAFVQARLEEQAIVSIGCLGKHSALLANVDPQEAQRLMGREEALEGLAPAWFAAGLEDLLGSSSEKARLWTLVKRVMPRWKEQE